MEVNYKGYTIRHYKDHYIVESNDGSDSWEVQTIEEGKYDIDQSEDD